MLLPYNEENCNEYFLPNNPALGVESHGGCAGQAV
jgi:hypothetical protein